MTVTEQQLVADADVQAVLEYMCTSIPVVKLVSVAERLPEMARLLWGGYPQEPCVALELRQPPITNGLQPSASEYCLEAVHVDDGSEVAGVTLL